MKKILILIGLALAAACARGVTLHGGENWQPLPATLKGDVEEFFTTLELALNGQRVEIVMSLYAPDATEELPADRGGMMDLAAIRRRRVAEMEKYASTSTTAPAIPIESLLYLPGTTPGSFRVKYVVRGAAASALLNAKAGEVIYGFRSSKNGLQLASTQFQPLAAVAHDAPPKKPAAAPRQPLDPHGPMPKEVMLSNGVLLRQVVVLNWQPDALLIQHAGGTVPIRLEHMAPEERAYFLANMVEALQRQRAAQIAAARATAAGEQQRTTLQENTAELEARVSEMRAQRDDEIGKAISLHHLLVGMDKDQVRRAWGSPTTMASVDRGGMPGSLWIYEGRGIDEHGNPANAGVSFAGEHVISLYNVKNR